MQVIRLIQQSLPDGMEREHLVRLMESEQKRAMGLRRLTVDNYLIFCVVEKERVIVMRVLYSASDIGERLKD